MIHKILRLAYETVDRDELMRMLEAVWKSDRMFTFQSFERTAKMVVNQYKDWGLESKVLKIPADGSHVPERTDWRMPTAWNCSRARLEILEPAEIRGIIADRDKVNCAVVQYSGPTPEHGLEAEIALIENAGADDLANLPESAVRGKFILLLSNPRGPVKKKLAQLGAVGIIVAYSGSSKCDDPSVTFWINGWSDMPGGWALVKGDSRLPGMVLSPEAGARLADAVRAGTVRARMTVISEYYDGHIPLPVGFLPGEGSDEVLVNSHMAEQGANDNASGSAVVIETMRVVKKMANMFAGGKLKRGLRSFLTMECYGTAGYISRNRTSLKRTVGALNWDCIGVHSEKENMPFPVHLNPISSAGYTDTLILLLFKAARKYLPFFTWHEAPYYMGDTFFMDPETGVPTVYGGGVDRNWHTARDTIEVIDPEIMHMMAAISSAYSFFLANAGEPEALWLSEHTSAYWHKKIAETSAIFAGFLRAGNEALEDLNMPKSIMELSAEVRLFHYLDTLEILGEAGEAAVLSALRLVDRPRRPEVRKKLAPAARSLKKFAASEKKRLAGMVDYSPRPREYPSRQFAVHNIPVKKFIGPATFDSVEPRRRREELIKEYGSPRWNAILQVATFLTDGKRTLDEIIRRTIADRGLRVSPENLAVSFRGLGEAGLLDFKRVKD